MGNSGEDTRNNKRDCPHDDNDNNTTSRREQEKGDSPGENCRKLRENNGTDNIKTGKQSPSAPYLPKRSNLRLAQDNLQSPLEPVDIELALNTVFQQNGTAEQLSNKISVTFRVGHAGDASAIEACYRYNHQQPVQERTEPVCKPKENRNDEASSSSSLELWLSQGMGDEDTPPSVFSVLVDATYVPHEVEKDNTVKLPAAMALFTVAYPKRVRALQLDFFYIGESLPRQEAKLLARRMLLRLSALALMTGAHLRGTESIATSLLETTS